MNRSWRITVAFLILVICLYPLGVWLLLRFQSASPLMLTVGLATIGACAICRRDLGSLGWHWGDWYDRSFVEELRAGYLLESWTDEAIIALRFVLTGTVSFVLRDDVHPL